MSDMSEAPRMERPEDPVSKMTNNRQFKLLADIPVRMSVEAPSWNWIARPTTCSTSWSTAR